MTRKQENTTLRSFLFEKSYEELINLFSANCKSAEDRLKFKKELDNMIINMINREKEK